MIEMTNSEALESYVNGNISFVKEWLADANTAWGLTFGEFLESYVNGYNPSVEQILLFVKRLAPDS